MEQAKREKILDAAVREFARHGFKKASIEAIADAAGVGKGTIYLAAETKEDLFYQAVHKEVRGWSAAVGRHIDPSKTAEELLVECAMAGFLYMESKPLVRDLLFGAHNLILQEFPDRLEQLQEIGIQNILEILRIGVRQGRFRAEMDVQTVAWIMQDASLATHLLHHARLSSEQIATRMRVGLDLMLNGVRVRSGS